MRINVRTQPGPRGVTVVKRTEQFADGELPNLHVPTLIDNVMEYLGAYMDPETVAGIRAGMTQAFSVATTDPATDSRKAVKDIDALLVPLVLTLSTALIQGDQTIQKIDLTGLDLRMIDPTGTNIHDVAYEWLTLFGTQPEVAEQIAAGAQQSSILYGDRVPDTPANAIANLTMAFVGMVINIANSTGAMMELGGTVESIGSSLAAKADLDENGKLLTWQLPPLAITSVRLAGSEGEMLSGDGQEGDVVVRSDIRKTFILSSGDSTVLESWVPLECPTEGVTSFNGEQGDVVVDLPVAKTAAQWYAGDGVVPLHAALVNVALDADATLTIENPPPGRWSEFVLRIETYTATGPVYLDFNAESLNHWPHSAGYNPLAMNTTYEYRVVAVHGETGANVDFIGLL